MRYTKKGAVALCFVVYFNLCFLSLLWLALLLFHTWVHSVEIHKWDTGMRHTKKGALLLCFCVCFFSLVFHFILPWAHPIEIHVWVTGMRYRVAKTHIGCLKSHAIFRKRASIHTALLRKMIYKDMASYDSTPPCFLRKVQWPCVLISVYVEIVTHSHMGEG